MLNARIQLDLRFDQNSDETQEKYNSSKERFSLGLHLQNLLTKENWVPILFDRDTNYDIFDFRSELCFLLTTQAVAL